jgi:hypothetical protein
MNMEVNFMNASPAEIQAFVLGGHATFTLESQKTLTHYTYTVSVKDKADGSKIYFIGLLMNGDEYRYIAVLDPESLNLRFTAKSKLSIDAPSVRALLYFFNGLKKNRIPNSLTVYHSGKCGCCGRELTDPESIRRGIGPVCFNK